MEKMFVCIAILNSFSILLDFCIFVIGRSAEKGRVIMWRKTQAEGMKSSCEELNDKMYTYTHVPHIYVCMDVCMLLTE